MWMCRLNYYYYLVFVRYFAVNLINHFQFSCRREYSRVERQTMASIILYLLFIGERRYFHWCEWRIECMEFIFMYVVRAFAYGMRQSMRAKWLHGRVEESKQQRERRAGVGETIGGERESGVREREREAASEWTKLKIIPVNGFWFIWNRLDAYNPKRWTH